MKRKFFIHAILYTAAPKLPTMASFFVLPIISPYLTLKDYGKFGLVIACYSFFLMTVTLGQKVILQNSFFEYKNKYNLVWRRSYGIMLSGSLIGSLFLAIAFFFLLGKTFDSGYLLVTGMCAVALICSPIETLAQVYYVFREHPYSLGLRALIMSLLNIVLLLITVKYLKLGFAGLVAGFASGSIFSLFFYFYPICIKNRIYPVFFFKKKHLVEYLKVGSPLLPHSLSLSIFNTSDRILLSFYKVNVSRIGLYSQGYGIGANAMVFINGVFSAIGRTLQLSFRNRTKEDKRRIRTIFIFLISGIGIILFNIALWMKEIYSFLFRNPELQTGYPIAILVLMAHVFFPLYNFGVYSLFIAKKTKVIARISAAAAFANLILNLILIPFFNIWATVLITSFSFMLLSVVVLFTREVQQELKWVFPKLNHVYIISIFYGVAITILVWYLKDVYWAIKLIVSLATFLLALYSFFYGKTFFLKYYSFIQAVGKIR